MLHQTNTILVCDNALRCVKLFHKDGTFVCDFIQDLQYPCAITENYKGDILVCDYVSKVCLYISKVCQDLQYPCAITENYKGDILV